MNSATDHSLTQTERMSIISGIVFTLFLGSMMQSSIGPALPTIGHALGDIEFLPWTITAYLVSATAATPLYGKLSDIYGRRQMLLLALSLFMVGSIFCALSQSVLSLSFGRAVQGLGGGGLISLCQAVIGDHFAPRDRGQYQGYLSVAFTASNVGGPILGGVLAQYAHWSLIFWINLPFGLIAIYLMNRVLSRRPSRRTSQNLDIFGSVMLVLFTLSLLFALSWGGTRYPWTSPEILGLAGVTVLLLIVFVWHTRRAVNPILPLAVLRNRVVSPVATSNFFTMLISLGIGAYLPIYFQLVVGLSPGVAGLALMGPVFGAMMGGVVMGRLIGKLENPKRFGAIVLLIGCAATTTLAYYVTMPLIFIEALLAISSFSIGVMFPIGTVSTQNAVDPRHLGVAIATLNFIRTIGAAVGGAVFGSLILGSGNPVIVQLIKEGTHTAGAVDPAVTAVFSLMFTVVAVSYFLSFLSLLFMEHRPLRATL